MSVKQYFKLWQWSKGKRLYLWLNLLFSLIGYGAQLIAPFTLGKAVDAILPYHVQMEEAMNFVFISAILYLVSSIFIWFAGICAQSFASNMISMLREKSFDTLTKLPLSYLDSHAVGEIMNHFANDGDLVFDALVQMMNQLFSAIIIVGMALIFMFSINALMTIIVLAMTPIIFIVSRKITMLSSLQFRKQQELTSAMNGKIEEYLQQQRLLIAYNYQDKATEVFEEMNQELNEVGKNAQFYSALTNPTTRLVNNLTYIFLGLGGALSIAFFGLSIGALTSFFSYSILFSRPFNEISSVFSQLIAGQISLTRIFNLIEEPVESENYVYKDSDIAKEGIVNFQNVSFGYEKNKPIIKDFNAYIEKNSKIAIVGPTGAGKSTMINLLMRFYEVDEGHIFVDNKDNTQINRDALRLSFGIVLQDTWLFEGSIAANIAYGKPDATREEIVEAAKQANCHGFIMNLNDGYDSFIYEGSTNISLGQRQLITIARMLLIKPTILILDEATSNIDGLSEKKIQETFTEVMKNHTSFYIAHRLTSVIGSDLILVMNEGEIVEQGTHQELMVKKGFYYRLFMSQFDAI